MSVVTVRVYGSDNVQEFYNDSNESPFTVYWTLTSEGAYQTVIATATSNAGHTATAQVTVNIDRTPPVVIPPHYDGSSAGSEAGDNWHFQATTTGGVKVYYWPMFRYDYDPGMALTEGPMMLRCALRDRLLAMWLPALPKPSYAALYLYPRRTLRP